MIEKKTEGNQLFFSISFIIIFSVTNVEKENDENSRGNNNLRGVNAPAHVMVRTKVIVNFVPRKKV